MNEIVLAATVQSPVTTSDGTITGSIVTASFGLIATALDNEISTSLTATTNEAYLYVTGTGKSNLNLVEYDINSSAIYNSFATVAYGAESVLSYYTQPAPPLAFYVPVPATYVSNAVQLINARVDGLAQQLGNLVYNTSVASRASVIQGQLTAKSPGSLIYQLDSLFGASASPDGSIADPELPLLFGAIDAAISASYSADSVEGYILATV
jgi:hypothetical protein